MLLAAGVEDVIGCDRQGVVYTDRPGLDACEGRLRGADEPARAARDGRRRARGRGRLHRSLAARRGLGRGDPLDGRRAQSSSRWRIRRRRYCPRRSPAVAVIGTGRSDYPNQINNVLAFPGVFRGALDVRASAITEEMKLAAAQAIAAVVKPDELEPDYVIPSVFNRDVAPAVAAAVAQAAESSGVARRHSAVTSPA